MPIDPHNDRTPRRTVLQKIAGSTVVGLGLTAGIGTAAAGTIDERPASEWEMGRAMRSPRVRSLRKALGNPSIRPQDSTVQETELEGGQVVLTKLATEIGPIYYGEYGRTDGGGPVLDKADAQFHIDKADEDSLPEEYRDLPPADSLILTGQPDGVVLSRLATDSERKRIMTALPIDVDQMVAYTESIQEGFSVKAVDTAGRQVAYHAVVRSDDLEVTEVEDDVRIASDHCDDADWCWRCVQSVAICSACFMACGGATPACVICLLAGCGASGYSCSACVMCN
jgi:hypothetical protein